MERTYLALIEKDPDSDYSVYFPDLPGCVTAGSTFEEAREWAAEALSLHLEGMARDGDYIPSPSSADVILADPEAADAIALIVVEVLPERTEEEARAAFDEFMASEYGRQLMRETAPEWEQDEAAMPAN